MVKAQHFTDYQSFKHSKKKKKTPKYVCQHVILVYL